MKDGCLNLEEIVLAHDADESDPRRRHLQQCSRCRALASSLELFQRDGELPAGADPADAQDRLIEFLQREVAAAPGPSRPRVVPLERKRRLPARPVLWATAAVLAVAVGLPVLLNEGSRRDDGIILRAEEAGSRIAWQVQEPQRQADGSIQLAWTPLDSMASYEVVLLDGRQKEAGRLDAGANASLRITSDDLAVLAGRSRPWYVRIVARDEIDERMRSLPRLLPAPVTQRQPGR